MNSINVEIPRSAIEDIARQVFEQMTPAVQPDTEAEDTRKAIGRLMAKEFLSIREVSFLFGCSENHVRTLIQRAVEKSTKHPIPYCDLDGLVVFERVSLLAWAHERKPLKVGQRKSGGKKKQFPRAVNS